MNITTEHHAQVSSLAFYASKGEGKFEPLPADQLMGLSEVEVTWRRNDDGTLYIEKEENGPRAYLSISALTSEGKVGVAFLIHPVSYQLGQVVEIELDQPYGSLGEAISDVVRLAREHTNNMHQDNEDLDAWGSALMNYATKGEGSHVPHAADQLMGLEAVQVVWPRREEDANSLIFETRGNEIRYVLGVAYKSHNTDGSVAFRALAVAMERL